MLCKRLHRSFYDTLTTISMFASIKLKQRILCTDSGEMNHGYIFLSLQLVTCDELK